MANIYTDDILENKDNICNTRNIFKGFVCSLLQFLSIEMFPLPTIYANFDY